MLKHILKKIKVKYLAYIFTLITAISLISYCKIFYINKKLVLLYDQFPIFVMITLCSVVIFAYLLFLGYKCSRMEESITSVNNRLTDQSYKIDDIIKHMEKNHHEVIKSDKILQHFILEVLNNIRKE